jgi:hypothetical protein
MSDSLQVSIAQVLEEMHEELLHRVVKILTAALPMIGVPEHAENRALLHQQHMESTVLRFHQIVLSGAMIDMRLIAAEYDWAGRKLAAMGANWEHQATLIESYFAEAAHLHDWTPEQRAALEQMKEHVLRIAGDAYNATPAV